MVVCQLQQGDSSSLTVAMLEFAVDQVTLLSALVGVALTS